MRVLLLLPLVQAEMILTLSTKGFATEPPYELNWVDPSTGQLTEIFNLGNYGPPTSNCLWQANNTVVYPIQNATLGAYFAMIKFSAGTIHLGRTYANTAFYDIQFDKATDQTFAFVNSASVGGIFEVLPDQTLQGMTKLSGGVYGTGAYSSSKHIYFLRAGHSNVLAVRTVGPQKGAILYNVSTDFDQVGNLVYDDTFGVLYVWGYNNRTILASVDYTTGKTLKTFFTATHIAGPTCIDKAATTVYTSLFDQATNRAMIHSVDLASGKASQVPTDRYAITMNCLSNSKQNFYEQNFYEQKTASISHETSKSVPFFFIFFIFFVLLR